MSITATTTAAPDRRIPWVHAHRGRAERRGLSPDGERDLAARLAAGDSAAGDRMVEANLGLVYSIALSFIGRGMELEDLVSEGHLGLIQATRRFDAKFGARFSTYAAYWIKQAMRQALIDTGRTIRLPAHTIRLLTKWRRAERRFVANSSGHRLSRRWPRHWT